MTRHQRNGRIAAQVEDARDCLADLARRGALIIGVHVGGEAPPLIHICQPVRGLRGERVRVAGIGSQRIETWNAHHKHCAIEWRISL
jgi:hypothetical protein